MDSTIRCERLDIWFDIYDASQKKVNTLIDFFFKSHSSELNNLFTKLNEFIIRLAMCVIKFDIGKFCVQNSNSGCLSVHVKWRTLWHWCKMKWPDLQQLQSKWTNNKLQHFILDMEIKLIRCAFAPITFSQDFCATWNTVFIKFCDDWNVLSVILVRWAQKCACLQHNFRTNCWHSCNFRVLPNSWLNNRKDKFWIRIWTD